MNIFLLQESFLSTFWWYCLINLAVRMECVPIIIHTILKHQVGWEDYAFLDEKQLYSSLQTHELAV